MIKKRHILAITLAFCLAASLIVASVGYDPWVDLDDDGDIDPDDFAIFAGEYGTSGTPINKTEKLLELEARIDSLNMTLLTEYYNITDCHVVFVDASGDAIAGYLDVDSGTLYVHAGYDRVGIGTTSPTYTLDVNGTLRANQIRLGSTEGNHVIYFYEDGFPIIKWESFRWEDLDDRFRLSDDLHITGSLSLSGYLDVDSGTLYVDDINDRVGIGNTNPQYKLEVGNTGDLTNYVRVNSADFGGILICDGEGTYSGAIIYYHGADSLGFQTGGWEKMRITSDGNVGIGTLNPTTKLDVVGDATIGGTLNANSIAIPTTERYYSIPAIAWQPERDEYDYIREPRETWTMTDGPTYWYAPVNLPHGAVVTEFMAVVVDDSPSDVSVRLYRHAGGSLQQMADVESTGSSPLWQSYTDSSIDYATVDNEFPNAYFVCGILRSGDASHALSNVRITYNITETLP